MKLRLKNVLHASPDGYTVHKLVPGEYEIPHESGIDEKVARDLINEGVAEEVDEGEPSNPEGSEEEDDDPEGSTVLLKTVKPKKSK